ncbi:MAG: glycosyltransferase family 2 protein [Oscillospiraceae bacterium]|nr:glycosyltransferase family 2 protein [Oscillospiraceae bacterium]
MEVGLISIIMAAYNAEKTISQAIDSVLQQTYSEFELIVINDCSTDRTADIVKAYSDSRIRFIENKENQGVSKTRHAGALAAKGDWIAILDSDDMWTADKLEKQVLLQEKTKAELLYTGSSFIKADGTPIDWVMRVPEVLDYKNLLKQNLLSNSSSLVKKELFLNNETIDDGLHEDFACWLKILKTGIKAYGVDEPLLIYRLTSTSKSGNKFRAAKMNWNTYQAIGLNPVVAVYYMCCYIRNGLKKYRNLKG